MSKNHTFTPHFTREPGLPVAAILLSVSFEVRLSLLGGWRSCVLPVFSQALAFAPV